jgi:hypothetical protein
MVSANLVPRSFATPTLMEFAVTSSPAPAAIRVYPHFFALYVSVSA